VHALPLGSRQSKGRAIVNLLPFRQDEKVRAVLERRLALHSAGCDAAM